MNIRTINYTVYANGTISPVSPQDAGVAGDHDVTKVIFNVAAITDNNYLYRIQHVDAAGCVNATENLIRTDNNVSCSLPRGWTMVGGTATIQLVITEVDENDNTEAILYTFSGKLYYEPRDAGSSYSEGDLGRNLSGMLHAARMAAETSSNAAESALEDAEDAESFSVLAEESAVRAEKSAEASSADAKSAADDAIVAQLSAQEAKRLMDDIAHYRPAGAVFSGGNIAPMLTFIDDDAEASFPDKWRSIIDDTGIPVTISVSPAKIGDPQYGSKYMTWDTIKRMVDELGCETAVHGYNHIPLAERVDGVIVELPESQIESEAILGKGAMVAQGLQANFFVYPKNIVGPTGRKIIRKYYDFAVGGREGFNFNVHPLDTYFVNRTPLTRDAAANNLTLDQLKAFVDDVAANNAWGIFMTHSYQAGFDADMQQTIRDIITYARENGVEIVNAQTGFKAHGNIIDAADNLDPTNEKPYTLVGANGTLKASGVHLSVNDMTTYTVNSVPNDFPRNCIITFPEDYISGLPSGHTSGTITVYRYNNVLRSYSFQLLHTLGGALYWRRAVSNTAWGATWDPFNASGGASLPYVLAPTGDNTDRTAEIQNCLTTYGICQLQAGDYHIAATGVVMPDNSTLTGAGASTNVYLGGAYDSTAGQCVTMGSNCTVSAISFMGWTGTVSMAASLIERHGVLWTTNAGGTAPQNGKITNCRFMYFKGAGITCKDTGTPSTNSLSVSDCFMKTCRAGINVAQKSEYNRFTNINAAGCYYGCINNGGNNVFVNCTFTQNTIGMKMDDTGIESANSEQGSFVGCTFNHSGNNTGVGISITNVTHGFVFSGCQLFSSSILLTNASGIVFDGLNVGQHNEAITVSGGGTVLFNGCMFGNTPTVTITDNENVHFANCYIRASGTAVTRPTS